MQVVFWEINEKKAYVPIGHGKHTEVTPESVNNNNNSVSRVKNWNVAKEEAETRTNDNDNDEPLNT